MNIKDEIEKLNSERMREESFIKNTREQILTLENDILTSEKRIFKIDAKLEVYLELLNLDIGKKKELTDQQLIEVAKEVISKDPKMQRVNKIATALISKNFEFEAHEIARRMVKTGKFRINPEKYWEIVNEEDGM